MSSKKKILAIVPAMVLGIGLALPAFAQETSAGSGASAGTSMNQAGADTAGAAKNAFHGAATALDDTRISGRGVQTYAYCRELTRPFAPAPIVELQ